MNRLNSPSSKKETQNMDYLAGKYLTFRLGKEEYGLEIMKVVEIIGLMEITPVPRTPEFIRGVINLRGKIIPVIDLRIKFDLPGKEDSARTCIIVVQITKDDRQITMGIIVDEVSEVLNITPNQIEPTPDFGSSVDTQFIMGVGQVGQNVIMLLDIGKVLTAKEMNLVDQVPK